MDLSSSLDGTRLDTAWTYRQSQHADRAKQVRSHDPRASPTSEAQLLLKRQQQLQWLP